jgi:HPt (histidine-containing phosphotransfer) domain-containing protein
VRLGNVPLLGLGGDARTYAASPALQPRRVLPKPVRADDLLAALESLEAPAVPAAESPLAGLEAMAREMEMDAAMIAELCQSFLQRGEEYLLELAAAAQPRDDERLDRAAHGFKGMAGNLRFRRLTELADELRRAAREHTGDPAALCGRLREEFAAMRRRLEERWLLGSQPELQH